MSEKFKLLVGRHSGTDIKGKERLWPEGSVIESNIDLCTRFNQPDSEKFRKMPDDTPSSEGWLLVNGNIVDVGTSTISIPSNTTSAQVPNPENVDDTFNAMTLVELKRYAEEEEIDLQGATLKAEILKIVRTHNNLSHAGNQ